MKQYEVILLDVDGTLLNFDASEQICIRDVMRHFHIEPTSERIARYHKINAALWAAFERGEVTKERLYTQRFETFFEQENVSDYEKKAVEAGTLYRDLLSQSAILIPGAKTLCADLSKRYPLYIVTNGNSQTQYSRLALSGLDQYMKDIFVSEDAGSQKPQKAYFDYCFSRIPQANPEKMLLVGDSLHSDIAGGNAAGTDTCWYNPSRQARPDAIKIDWEIHDLEELRALL